MRTFTTGGGPMEPDRPLGYHHPAGARAPETTHGLVYACEEHGHRFEVQLIRDFECNWTDVSPETCPYCGDYRIKLDQSPLPEEGSS